MSVDAKEKPQRLFDSPLQKSTVINRQSISLHSHRRSQTAATKNLMRQNQELTTLRDWLLPMLMNGHVRVG
jgi:hypothetical protein